MEITSTSPRPWHREPGDNPRDFSRTKDANGCFIFGDNSGPSAADAALIVDAVNAHDGLKKELEKAKAEVESLKEILRGLADQPCEDCMHGTSVWGDCPHDGSCLADKARAALKEGVAQ